MADRGIIMQGRSVRDLLAGRKTQTRRKTSWAKVGDLLWVRESCRRPDETDDTLFDYAADELDGLGPWTSPMFMPKAAARIWLRVTAVRQERLHDLTDEDAVAEGYADRRDYFAAWRKLHGRAENVAVTVITFEVDL